METYLSASSPSTLDLSTANFDRPTSNLNGTDTPKDLTQRLRIIELFTLHVLPRNDEWDYARSFISNSDILDEERREAFLQTLQELRDVKDSDGYQDDVFEDSSEEPQVQQYAPVKKEANATVNGTMQPSAQHEVRHKRTSSEVDYGIEKSHPNGSAAPNGNGQPRDSVIQSSVTKTPQASSSTRSASRPTTTSTLSPPSQTPRNPNTRRSSKPKQNDLISQVRQLFHTLQNLISNLTGTMTGNPTTVFRLVLFLLAFLMAFSRPEIRDRVRRIVGSGWGKVRQTVGMGVKVSYI